MKRLLYLPAVVKSRPFTLRAARARFPCLMSGRISVLTWEAEGLECVCCVAEQARTTERLWTMKRLRLIIRNLQQTQIRTLGNTQVRLDGLFHTGTLTSYSFTVKQINQNQILHS